MERTIKEVRMLLKELDEKYGIKTSDVEIKLNRRYTRTLGVCFTKGKEVVKFEFSELFFNLDYETFTQIVKHEWSHAYDRIVYNGKGHGKTFKMTCDMVGCIYDGTKCYDHNAIEQAQNNMLSTFKYAIVCANCGCETKMVRKNKAFKIINNEVSSLTRYRCTKCDSYDLIAKTL